MTPRWPHIALALTLTASLACEGDSSPPPRTIPEPDPPAPLVPLEPDVPFEELTENLGVRCATEPDTSFVSPGDTIYAFEFELGAQDTSALFVPFVTEGTVEVVAVDTPNGRLDVRADYKHQNIRLSDLGQPPPEPELDPVYGAYAFDWPLMFPYSPRFRDTITPGSYTAYVSAPRVAPCAYVLDQQEKAVGTIDLTVYLTDIQLASASNAAESPNLVDMFERVDELLGTAGVRLGSIEYVDLPEGVRDRYTVIRETSEIYELMSQGVGRSGGIDGNLNIDIFLVLNIATDDGTLGLSGGLPGAPGMHGNRWNGLVFETAALSQDNGYIAHIMAHEIGHYLGLRHTTEAIHGSGLPGAGEFDTLLGLTDPLDDTLVCDEPLVEGYDCPDADNLMFPSAPINSLVSEPYLTEQQGLVMRWNPHVR